MSKHSKCSVPVYSSRGRSFTTRRGARRLVARGLASERADGGIQMVETDHRFACETSPPQPPRLTIALRLPTGENEHCIWYPDNPVLLEPAPA